ncbi:MAG: hypothetical protein KBC41_02155 [Candidatus Pacebacteria bacterium]|nr:hypothetical protein [Candidatus Paceibacterota bacterium]MBP9866858.1 hypothetical protein [Candidatus Paceibacterota bacterium]
METKTIPDVVEQKKDIESSKNLFALHQRDYIQGVNNLNGMDFKDPSYSFSVYKVRSEEANLFIEGDVAADIANNAEEIIEELSLVKGDSTKLLRKIGSGELSDTVSRVAAERAVQDSVTSEGSKPLFMRDALDLIRERAERIKNEGLIVGATSSSQENNYNSIEFTAEPVSGYKIIKQGDYIKNNSTDFDLKERDLSSVSTGTDQAGSMSIVDEKIKEKELS